MNSNLNKEFEYNQLEDVLEFVLSQHIKGLYTAIPGIIDSYNPATKRATVTPAIQRVMTDGSSRPLPTLQDVPVLFPSGGGFALILPVKVGDAVMLVFSQRGIANFKTNFDSTLPSDGMLSLEDAVAIPGFGALNINPASQTGAALQSEDGNNAIILADDKIELKLGAATLTLTNSALISSVPIQAVSYAGTGEEAATMTAGINMSGQSISDAGDVTTSSGVSLESHKHGGVQSGGDETGGPV